MPDATVRRWIDHGVITLTHASRLTGLCPTTIQRLVAEQRFPAPVDPFEPGRWASFHRYQVEAWTRERTVWHVGLEEARPITGLCRHAIYRHFQTTLPLGGGLGLGFDRRELEAFAELRHAIAVRGGSRLAIARAALHAWARRRAGRW